MSQVIECIYEHGVFRPLEKVEFKEGDKLKVKIEKIDISKYYGIFGKASIEELRMLEEEAQI